MTISSNEDLIKIYSDNQDIKYIFFWGHTRAKDNAITKSCFSQWYEAEFTVDGVVFKTTEQYMMSEKAKLFNDTIIFNQIMAADSPKEVKELGRKIANFDSEIWNHNKFNIVVKGNYAKFNQNPELANFLLRTDDSVIVEASPYDKIWGIGLAENDKNIKNPLLWKGENLLGYALMIVREKLKQQNSI